MTAKSYYIFLAILVSSIVSSCGGERPKLSNSVNEPEEIGFQVMNLLKNIGEMTEDGDWDMDVLLSTDTNTSGSESSSSKKTEESVSSERDDWESQINTESDAPAEEVYEEAPAYQLNMDPQMIGVWRRTESYSDPISGFSYVIQETLALRGDGTVEFSSKSAGGNGGVTGATPGQELKGYWKTEKKFLFTSDFPTGPWMNNGNYLVDAHTMMLKQSGGNKLWNRIQ